MDREFIEKHGIAGKYRQDKLTPEQRVEFEEYFIDKPDLLEQLELDALLETGMRSADQDAMVGPTNDQPLWLGFNYLPIAASGLLIALTASVVFNVYQSTENTRIANELSSANSVQSNVQILRLSTLLSNDSDFRPAGTLVLKADTKIAVVNIQLPFPEDPVFSVRILNHPSLSEVMVIDGLEPRGAGDLSFSLPRNVIESGDYYAEVAARDNEPIRIPFRIVQERQ